MSYYADDPALDAPVMAELVEQPPLSIGHLLLWILGSAVVLGSYRWLAEPAADEGRLLFQLDQFARSLTLGGGVAALLIYARRLITRDAPLPRQPGHWLLVVQGLSWPAYWLTLLSIYGLRGTPQDDQSDWDSFRRYAVTTVLYYLWGTGVNVVVLACLRDARRWRMFFAVSAVLPLLHALLWCCLLSAPRLSIPERSFVLVRIAVTFACLGVCVLRDRAQRVPRDWMHFAGIGFFAVGVLSYLGIYLLLLFLPR